MLDILASPVGHALRAIHAALSTVFVPGSGPAWGLSIVLLTVSVRLLLFPLFVKQIKSQRRMQELAPRIKELQKLHKGDRETLNTEMMKLYKVNNANPISGCLPLVLQLPVFFALFSVIREFKPNSEPKYGLSADLLREAASARIFGAPISASFKSPPEFIASLGGGQTTVRVVAAIMVVLMGASTYYTQRQMMARANTSGADSTQMQVQKIMLYVLPLSFAVSGVLFPIGVLLYWLTTNVWSMGQQAYVIKRMPPPALGGPVGGPTARAADASAVKSRKVGAAAAAGQSMATTKSGTKASATKGKATVDLGKRPSGTATIDEPAVTDVPASRPAAGSRAVTGAGKRPQQASKKKGRRGGRH